MSASFASKETAFSHTGKNCFWECMAGEGSDIARGMVGGAVFGGMVGVAVGAGGGTVVFPILGTAVGGVAGGVLGAAEGAIYAAIASAFWSAADCAVLCGAQQPSLAGAGGCGRITEPLGDTGNGIVFQVCVE